MKISTVILAAGQGTRMKSDLPKMLHPLAGQTMIEWSVQVAHSVSHCPPVAIVGYGRELVQDRLAIQFKDAVHFAVQEKQLGTGHAVQQAEPFLRDQSDVVVVTYGDMPLLQAKTLQKLTTLFEEKRANADLAIAMLTIERDDPQGFGRIIRDEHNQIEAIVEEADCTPEQRQICELNPGVYCFDASWLWDNLNHIPLSPKGEYYLTDMVGIAIEQGRKVVGMAAPIDEVNGINTRVHLAQSAEVLRQRILEEHMLAGVTIIDPKNTYIDATVKIGQDTSIGPGAVLQGDTSIGCGSVVGPHSQVVDSKIGNCCTIRYSVIEDAQMEDNCDVGPFGHLRKGAYLAEGVHMGNFGEVKNSYLGPGVKMGHFSYLGDAQVGANANIGAGTITCNYDGQNKHKTEIGKDVFIGSDTMLVAPVTLDDGARTGAGAVVTRDVPRDTLVYGIPARPKSVDNGTAKESAE